jgi:mono/diheme cytochrome c family protein
MVALRAITASLLFVGACGVGEVPPLGGTTDGGTGGGQAIFDSTIKPMITAKNCANCHGPATAPDFTSYATLAVKYRTAPGATNILVTKADATAGMHQGIVYFDAGQKQMIANWIDGK